MATMLSDCVNCYLRKKPYTENLMAIVFRTEVVNCAAPLFCIGQDMPVPVRRYRALQCRALLRRALLHSALLHSALPHSTLLHSAFPHSAFLDRALLHNSLPYSDLSFSASPVSAVEVIGH